MLIQDRIDVSEIIGIKSIVLSSECKHVLDMDFRFQLKVCHNYCKTMLEAMSFNEVAHVSVNSKSYVIHFWYEER